jgi:hypothetical protein
MTRDLKLRYLTKTATASKQTEREISKKKNCGIPKTDYVTRTTLPSGCLKFDLGR